jgi:transposase
MKKRYTVSPTQAQEARQLMKTTKNVRVYRRLEVIALLGEGHSEVETAEMTHFSLHTLPILRRKFAHLGFKSLMNNHKGRPAQLSFEEVEQFLETYRESSEKAEILNVKQMWLDFQAHFGISYTLEAFYRLLKKHNWRKVKPRPEHPKKASLEEIEASKKLTL